MQIEEIEKSINLYEKVMKRFCVSVTAVIIVIIIFGIVMMSGQLKEIGNNLEECNKKIDLIIEDIGIMRDELRDIAVEIEKMKTGLEAINTKLGEIEEMLGGY